MKIAGIPYMNTVLRAAAALMILSPLSALAQDPLTKEMPPPPGMAAKPAADIEAIQKQIADLQAKLDAAKGAPDGNAEAKMADLEKQLAAIREQVKTLKPESAGFVSPAPPTKPAEPATPARTANERFRLGGSLVIPKDEVVKGDAAVVGGSMTVDGAVRGDISVLGGSGTVNGIVNGDADVTGGSLTVNGEIGGNIQVTGGGVSLGPNAVVRGDIQCNGGSVNRADSSVVEGAITGAGGSMDPLPRIPPISSPKHVFVRHQGPDIGSFIFFALAGIVLLAIAPHRLDTIGHVFIARPGHCFVVGLASFPAMVIMTVVSIITIVGVVIVPLLWALAGVMGIVAVVVMLGRRLLIGKTYRSRFMPLFMGLLVWFIAELAGQAVRPLAIAINIATVLAGIAALGAALSTRFGKNAIWLQSQANGIFGGPKVDAGQTYAGIDGI
jgi:cytoskeletal protein CcmA (bactofilin family)